MTHSGLTKTELLPPRLPPLAPPAFLDFARLIALVSARFDATVCVIRGSMGLYS